MKMSDFVNAFGITEADVVNWMTRLNLRTKYPDTRPGRARQFSRQNVMELAAIGALVSVGLRPADAVPYAEIIVDEGSGRFIGDRKRWTIFAAGNPGSAVSTDKVAGKMIDKLLEKSPTRSLVMIESGTIAQRVHDLFDSVGEL